MRDSPAYRGQCASERRHPLILRLIARGAPLRVISTLFATTRIAARTLQMSIGLLANPNITPCWWNNKCLDPRQRVFVAHCFALVIDVAKAWCRAFTMDTRLAVCRIAKPRIASCILRQLLGGVLIGCSIRCLALHGICDALARSGVECKSPPFGGLLLLQRITEKFSEGYCATGAAAGN